MIVVDSSALIAILLQEEGADKFALAMEVDERLLISAATLVESGAVALSRGGESLLARLQAIIADAGIEVLPVTLDQANVATEAYCQYGRGIGRPACLNFGDCFSYALAKVLNQPLLYKGDDFARTDLRSAL